MNAEGSLASLASPFQRLLRAKTTQPPRSASKSTVTVAVDLARSNNLSQARPLS